MEESEHREPRAPQQNLVDVLDVYDAENEDELVKNEVPEFILQMLLLRHPELAEHQLLDGCSDQYQPAERHIDHGLKKK